jgi:predicted glycosyltransferase
VSIDCGKPRIWIDVDNPPQVQYLVPFVDAFRRRGASVVLTARDYGNALDLLRLRSLTFHAIGKESGRSTVAKVTGVLDRARQLSSLFKQQRRPDVVLSASRSSALAARWMGIPSYVISDYEYVDATFYRLTRSTILYPQVIDPAPFIQSGLRRDRLIPFRGIKEDISLAAMDLQAIPAHRFPEIVDQGLVRVLFRPPAEKSHYFDPKSLELSFEALGHLAKRPEAVVVFSPRHPWQREHLERFKWRNGPVVLEAPIPFVSLLKGVDLVVCSGGTMLREAAYLGVPAYSIFMSRIGGVDRHLASIGRVHLISSAQELSKIKLGRAPGLAPLVSNPRLLDELADFVLAAGVSRRSKAREGAPI